jgi:hypothetical protein
MLRRPGTEVWKQLIMAANDEARRRGDRRLGTDHLVLGLLHERDSAASRALGVDLAAARAISEALDLSALRAVGIKVDALGEGAPASRNWSLDCSDPDVGRSLVWPGQLAGDGCGKHRCHRCRRGRRDPRRAQPRRTPWRIREPVARAGDVRRAAEPDTSGAVCVRVAWTGDAHRRSERPACHTRCDLTADQPSDAHDGAYGRTDLDPDPHEPVPPLQEHLDNLQDSLPQRDSERLPQLLRGKRQPDLQLALLRQQQSCLQQLLCRTQQSQVRVELSREHRARRNVDDV